MPPTDHHGLRIATKWTPSAKVTMKLWLTQCRGGRSMLTRLKPEIHRIRGTHSLDAFAQKGEPIDVRHLCPDGVKSLFGSVPPLLEPQQIELLSRFL